MSNQEIIEYLRGSPRTLEQVEAAVARYEGHDYALVERLAYYAFQGMPLTITTTAQDLEQAAKELRSIASNPMISSAGHAKLNPGPRNHDLRDASVWLLWLVLTRAPLEHWSLIVPAILNMIDSPVPSLKAVGAKFATLLAKDHIHKLRQTGLVPVFKEALEPLMSYVPPSIEPQQSQLILEPVIEALLELSDGRQDQNRVILLVFGALQSSQENIEYIRVLLRCLGHVVRTMGVNAVAHLQQLVHIFNSIACNPFFDLSEPLKNSLKEYMVTVLAECRPRVENYKYEIMVGAIKGKLDLPIKEFFTEQEWKEVEELANAAP